MVIMEMLLIICGKTLEKEVVTLFQDLGLKGYTVISDVEGSSVTGTMLSADPNFGTNTLFLLALGYESTFLPKILAALKAIRAQHVQGHQEHEIPLKVFLQPCDIII